MNPVLGLVVAASPKRKLSYLWVLSKVIFVLVIEGQAIRCCPRGTRQEFTCQSIKFRWFTHSCDICFIIKGSSLLLTHGCSGKHFGLVNNYSFLLVGIIKGQYAKHGPAVVRVVVSYPVNDAANCFGDGSCLCACRILHRKSLFKSRQQWPHWTHLNFCISVSTSNPATPVFGCFINPDKMKTNNFGGIFSGFLRWD